jgi:maleylacetate reductase
MGLHHKLAHVLGGRGLPHARTHAVLLPYTLAFNAPASPDTVATLQRAWGCDDPPAFLHDLQRSLGLSTSLRALGLTPADISSITDEVLASRYPNPREVDRVGIQSLLLGALEDRRPSMWQFGLADDRA